MDWMFWVAFAIYFAVIMYLNIKIERNIKDIIKKFDADG